MEPLPNPMETSYVVIFVFSETREDVNTRESESGMSKLFLTGEGGECQKRQLNLHHVKSDG